jgi:hypothetical protein
MMNRNRILQIVRVFPCCAVLLAGMGVAYAQSYKFDRYDYSLFLVSTPCSRPDISRPSLATGVLPISGPKFECRDLAMTGKIEIGVQSQVISGKPKSPAGGTGDPFILDAPLPTNFVLDVTVRNNGSSQMNFSAEIWIEEWLPGPVEGCPYRSTGQVESTPSLSRCGPFL